MFGKRSRVHPAKDYNIFEQLAEFILNNKMTGYEKLDVQYSCPDRMRPDFITYRKSSDGEIVVIDAKFRSKLERGGVREILKYKESFGDIPKLSFILVVPKSCKITYGAKSEARNEKVNIMVIPVKK